MKVVAYCIDAKEKILLATANRKRHDITLISTALNVDTVDYADNKSAVLLCSMVVLHPGLLSAFSSLGVELIITRFSVDSGLIANAGYNYGLQIFSVRPGSETPTFENLEVVPGAINVSIQDSYTEVIAILDKWQTSQV